MDTMFPSPVSPSADTAEGLTHLRGPAKWGRQISQLIASIGSKIILPYLLLTFIVAGAGAYIVTQLVTSSLQERFNNQLLDAGRIVSIGMVRYESERLAVLRAVAGTEGVPESLRAGNRDSLAAAVPQIGANSTTDAVELIDMQGKEVYGWQRALEQTAPDSTRTDADFSHIEAVNLVLRGHVDDLGDKRVFLSDTPAGLMLFTVGPVYQGEQQVGAVMVGTYIERMLQDIAKSAVAHVTLYTPDGHVVDTTLGSGQANVVASIAETSGHYELVRQLLQESPKQHVVVSSDANEEVPLRQVAVFDQNYTLAFGDWRLRDQSFGLFSVALPSNFITTVVATSRNNLSLLFAVASVAVFGIGFTVAQRIIAPLQHLVRTALAVAQGNLEERTQLRRGDEIGTLAYSFDVMTENLVDRTRQLVEQASELETVLSSIVDGVLVLDLKGNVVRSNPAAQKLMADITPEFKRNLLQELRLLAAAANALDEQMLVSDQPAQSTSTKRYRAGHRFFSAQAAPMQTPAGKILGSVIALRDTTREAEMENLQDGFVATISHELRTPLTAVKGYSDLLLKVAETGIDESHRPLMEKINTNANRLLTHVGKLIDITELQSDSLALNITELDWVELVTEVVEQWRERIEERQLTLTLSTECQSVILRGDAKRLRWAIDNLMSNAYNYTEQGEIDVELCCRADEVQLNIHDTGVGIGSVDQPYLFTRFFRAQNNHEFTYNVDGVGLGLFITRSIIDRHDGRAWAKSQLNVGSTFSITLPLHSAQDDQLPADSN